jgi:hypothetical protein
LFYRAHRRMSPHILYSAMVSFHADKAF